jgi:hypothetical protein
LRQQDDGALPLSLGPVEGLVDQSQGGGGTLLDLGQLLRRRSGLPSPVQGARLLLLPTMWRAAKDAPARS